MSTTTHARRAQRAGTTSSGVSAQSPDDRRASFVAATVAACSRSAPAHADVFKLFAEADGGAHGGHRQRRRSEGRDVLRERAARDVRRRARRRAGVPRRPTIQHHQYTDGSRVATWTQFGARHALRDRLRAGQAHSRSDAREHEGESGQREEARAGARRRLRRVRRRTSGSASAPASRSIRRSTTRRSRDKALIGEARLGFGKHVIERDRLRRPGAGVVGLLHQERQRRGRQRPLDALPGVQAEALVYLRLNLRLL